MMRIVLAGVGLVAVLACRGGSGVASCDRDASGPMRILFIGNSLTYTNALPQMLRSMVDSAGEAPPDVVDVTLPDYGLEQHWEDGRAAQALRARCWDVVVAFSVPAAPSSSEQVMRIDPAVAAVLRQAAQAALDAHSPR